MNSRQKKKHALFNKFSENLKHIIEVTQLQDIIPPFEKSDLYICPLSMKCYDREGLKNIYLDHLTLEHSPPESLKGSIVALTAKDHNSKDGHSQDISLQRYINNREFNRGIATIVTRGKVNDSISMQLSFKKQDPMQVTFRTKTFHFGAQKFVDLLKNQTKFNVSFKLPNIKNVDISFLKIAYLKAFETFGYILLFNKGGFNPHYKRVRELILNKNTNDHPEIIWFENDYDDEFLGVNIVTSPVAMRCILVIFDLKTENATHRFGVFLPAIDDYGFKGIENISKLKRNKTKFNFEMDLVSDSLDITKYDHSFYLWRYWQKRFPV